MLTVIREFFLLGMLTFGGGMAMIPLFLDIVLRHQWLTEAQFSNFIAISQSTPGPIAINMATFIGFMERSWLGGMIGSVVIVIPGFLLSVILSKFLVKHRDSRTLRQVISTMKASVLALLVFAVYVLAGSSVLSAGVCGGLLFALAMVLTFFFKIPIALYLGIFAVLGTVLL